MEIKNGERRITFKLAKFAKISGFNWVYYGEYYNNNGEEWLGISSNPSDYEDKYIKCSQGTLQTWLRDKYNIHIKVDIVKADGIVQWYYDIKQLSTKIIYLWNFGEKTFDTYEDALEQGLYTVLKLIINMKKIYYKNTPVKLGDWIDLNGDGTIRIKLNDDMIEANPDMFKKSNLSWDVKYVKCIEWDGSSYNVDEVYPIVDGKVKTDRKYNVNLDDYHLNFEDASEEDYNDQQLLKEAKERYLPGTRFIAPHDESVKIISEILSDTRFYWDKSHTIISTNLFPGDLYIKDENKWAEIVKDKVDYVKIKNDVEQNTGRWAAAEPGKIYKVIKYEQWEGSGELCYYNSTSTCISPQDCVPCSKEEYDFQELVEKMKIMYKIGDVVKTLSQSEFVDQIISLKLNRASSIKELWVRGTHINIQIYDIEKGWANKVNNHSNKLLSDYEGELLSNVKNNGEFYYWMKVYEPSLYWTKILRLIAKDLNGCWTPDWNSSEMKYKIIFLDDKYDVQFNYRAVDYAVYFKSKKLALHAIDLMGDKLHHIYLCNL